MVLSDFYILYKVCVHMHMCVHVCEQDVSTAVLSPMSRLHHFFIDQSV